MNVSLDFTRAPADAVHVGYDDVGESWFVQINTNAEDGSEYVLLWLDDLRSVAAFGTALLNEHDRLVSSRRRLQERLTGEATP